jgi:hypothetical protein
MPGKPFGLCLVKTLHGAVNVHTGYNGKAVLPARRGNFAEEVPAAQTFSPVMVLEF